MRAKPAQTKIEFRIFVPSEYEEEKAYLEERHRQGWRLEHVWPYVYRFAACEPKEYIYELDFIPMDARERECYVTMFKDYGWEHVQDVLQFSYFRKRADETRQQEGQGLFSDNASRIAMAQRIFRIRIVRVSVLLLISISLMVIRALLSSPMGSEDVALYIAYGLVLAFDAYTIVRSVRGFARLKRKYGF